MLQAARAFLAWRKAQPALLEGPIRMLQSPEPVLAFEREHAGERLLVVFNLSGEARRWPLPAGVHVEALRVPGVEAGTIGDGVVALPPRGAFYARLA